LPFWLDRTIMIIGWAWFINLYNFMDGIDGITGVESISISAGVCFTFSIAGISNPFAGGLSTLIIGACLGFLALNWHPAKIFLGDVGSIPLGYLCGFLLLTLAVKGQLIPALIIPAYYLADSGITLMRRAARGEKVWQAHREHFYQIAAQRLGRHDRVVWRIIATNIGLIGAAAIAVNQPLTGILAGGIIVAISLRKCIN
jgi:UDP-N-acetylmuramyl pentapeptide phosphotransferase/UDP-N-acetylglucosamine-1-phosphate transferase